MCVPEVLNALVVTQTRFIKTERESTMNSIHTALFYFGWAVAVFAAFFVQHWLRVAASSVASFCSSNVKPALVRFNKFLGRHDGKLAIFGICVTIFGTLLCAASSKWIGITDVRAFAGGLAILVFGMAATIRSLD